MKASQYFKQDWQIVKLKRFCRVPRKEDWPPHSELTNWLEMVYLLLADKNPLRAVANANLNVLYFKILGFESFRVASKSHMGTFIIQ